MHDVPNDDLVGRIRAGDRAALGTLYQQYFDALWRMAVVMTRDPERAEDIVQDVFLSLWTRRETLDVRGGIRLYLNGAVRHLVFARRKHDRIVSDTEAAVEQTVLDPPAVSHPQALPDVVVERGEFVEAYRRMIETLSERDRTALRLRWEERMTFDQIGAVLGLTAMGARGVVMRAQYKVQAILAAYRP